jgi:hypothetical protein
MKVSLFRLYYCLIFIILLTISFVSSQTVVQVEPQAEAPKESNWYDFLTSPIFWMLVFLVVVFCIFLIIIVFVIYYILKWIKANNDIFIKIKNERIKMASAHRRYNSKHWFRINKNTPIRLVKMENGVNCISKPVAYHRGDYVTQEGNIVISLNVVGLKNYFVYPKIDLLIIPNKEKSEVYRGLDRNGNPIVEIITNLPKAKDIVQFNENEILIYADSLSFAGHFLVPVLKTKEGKIIDLSMPVYSSMKEVAIHNYLYEQTDEFTKVAKKSMDINPNLRYEQKVRDSSQSVETPPKQQE